jgi:hypothetical protein
MFAMFYTSSNLRTLANKLRGEPKCLPAPAEPARGLLLLELDDVLENELCPGGSARLDEQASLCELPQFDRREAELFN